MYQRVFISHAVEDRAEAKTICGGLEKRDVRCWIAPRDIRPGTDWDEAVIDGVSECSEMVVVLSKHTNASRPVKAEVAAASKRGKRIIPVRICEVSPQGALEFYLDRAHWFDAFQESLESYLPSLALEIADAGIKAVERPRRAAGARNTKSGKMAQVFLHVANIEETSARATQIANQLESEGWAVARGSTDLEIHSRGIWIHGSAEQERLFARRLLSQMGIEARMDNRAEDVPLQIIVGQSGDENRAPAEHDTRGVGASGGSGRIEWTTDSSSVSSVPRLAVRLYFVENKGGTPGLTVKVVSDEPETIEGVHVNITNVLRWSEQHERFVMSRDIYDSGIEFRALEIGKATLHPGDVENVGFVNCEGGRIDFNGNIPDQGPAHYRVQSPGIWQVSFRVQAARDGRNQDGYLCLKWDGRESGASATPWECPRLRRAAEERAAKSLEDARISASLEPVLDGGIDWSGPAKNETRAGYGGLHHAVFRLGGRRKHRGRVYVEVDSGEERPSRSPACMNQGTDFIAHELGVLRPGETHLVPVFTVVSKASQFWLDKRLVPEHPFWSRPANFTLQPGTYVTDQPFLDAVHRSPLPPGTYRLAVVLILGDTEHHREFRSTWKEILVP